MPIIEHNAAIKCLVAVRGHPFDRTGFDAVFQSIEGITATMVDQPAAARLMNPDGMRGFDVLVLYDMPGLDFDHDRGVPEYLEPPQELREGFAALLEQGTGIVALHHALAGWPTWREYHDWLGGQFLYRPGEVRGRPVLDSGYRHDVDYEAEVVADHPVTAGLPQRFAMRDELYLCEVFEDEVTPFLRSSAAFTRDEFWSANRAVHGHMNDREGWDHAPGSNLIGWTKQAVNSALVYLQPGDGAAAYDNPQYRALVGNAIRWVYAQAKA